MKKKESARGKKSKKELPKINEKRSHRVTFCLNDTEYKAIKRHLLKYKIMNKSDWYRRTILAHIWQKLGEDLPMLFPEDEMR